MLSDTEEHPATKEPPIVITDDDSDFEGPVLIIDEDSCDQGQTASEEKEMEVFNVSQRGSSHDAGELNLGENLGQPPRGAEAEVEIADDKPAPVVEQPRKRKSKTKNICVTPGKPVTSRTPNLLNPPCSPLSLCTSQACFALERSVLPTDLGPFSSFLVAKGDSHPRQKDFSGSGGGTPVS